MKIVHTFDINDEPLVKTSTGIRTAELTYNGPRYIYVEACTILRAILVPIHFSDIEELSLAEEKLTDAPGRIVVKIDAQEKPLVAAIATNFYKLKIENYEEELPNGEIFKHEYSENPSLGEIFDIVNMKFDHRICDFEQYKFAINDVSDKDFKKNTQDIINMIDQALESNQYIGNDIEIVTNYKNQITEILNNYDGSIKHWKIKFPVFPVLD